MSERIRSRTPEQQERLREHWRQKARDRRSLRRKPLVGNHLVRYEEPPSPEQLAARDAALLAPRTLTSHFCGDPAPGRSALDARGGRE